MVKLFWLYTNRTYPHKCSKTANVENQNVDFRH